MMSLPVSLHVTNRPIGGMQCVWYKFREGDFHQDADGKAADEAAEAATNGRSHDSATSSNMRDHEANGAQTPGEAGDVRVVEDSATAADARSMLRVSQALPCAICSVGLEVGCQVHFGLQGNPCNLS